MEYTVFEKATGRIVRSGYCFPDCYELQTTGDASLGIVPEIGSDATYYMIGGAMAARPACPAIVDVDGFRVEISGVVAGSVVTATIEGRTVPVLASAIELDEAGPLTITIAPPWPYLEAAHDLVIE